MQNKMFIKESSALLYNNKVFIIVVYLMGVITLY